MRGIFITSFLLTLTTLTYSQDIIVKTSGEEIKCKITKIDSVNIYVTVNKGGQELNSFIEKTLVKEMRFGEYYDEKMAYKNVDSRSSFMFGLLEGGGSLIGLDFESMISNHIGLQMGGGYIGYGCGLNIHFKPTIRSSYISWQYWHQGIMNSYKLSLTGPNFVFRYKKLITAQLGLGYVLDTGSAWPDSMGEPDVILTYAIGIYLVAK